ncbi:hypothetical protein INP83_05485 [Mucilaginibacter sp. 21P]|uniref:hypothetical protein n=1 Tax=Mucilaginibacter sp. 21P TaxID=2778902 RepID=UPI001C57E33F|nr:hypothetical protein [Mucilaginibacter sp. 21P]QXV66537.1 hypothetical protein INP83_05485 [Mucilaginibacter sp. 21P]
MARNIISLHLDNSKGIEIIGNPFQSIQSSYKVYEKQNIKQYIEIRNKISDQLLTFHDRANKIVESFASGFQKSALALISFYISAIIIKLIGKPVFKDIFTIDSTILSSVFICFSYIYYRIALWEVKEQRKRFIGSYKNMKQRYLDLLDVEDIKRILNDDKEYYADLSFLDDKQQKYANLWKYYLLGLFIVTTSLFLYYHH